MSVGFELHHPTDLQGKGVFFYSGDPIAPKLYAAIGGITPKQLTINEILPNLTNGTINVLTAPPLGAEQLQWASRGDAHQHRDGDVRHRRPDHVVGAPPGSAAEPQAGRRDPRPPRSADRLTKTIRNLDAQSFARLKQRRPPTS